MSSIKHLKTHGVEIDLSGRFTLEVVETANMREATRDDRYSFYKLRVIGETREAVVDALLKISEDTETAADEVRES